MNIEVTPREDHQVTVLVEVEADRMTTFKRKAARKISEKAKIPGFRPGKASYEVVRRFYGDATIFQEAVDLMVEEIYPEALAEAKIEPGAMGSLENVEGTDAPKLTFCVPLSPSVELGDYKSIRLPYEWAAPGEDKLAEAIDNMRRMYSRTETVERAAEDGDYVSVDVVGKDADGTALIERNGFALVVGKDGGENEFPYQGFSKEMTGLKAGDTKSLSHTYGADAAQADLAGKTLSIDVTIKAVRAVNLPELTDDFAKTTGLGQSADEMRERMKENLDNESREAYDDEYFTNVLEQVKATATIKYPPQVIEHETEHVVEDLKHRLSHQGIEFNTYLKVRELDEQMFAEQEAKPIAIKRLERGLIIDQLAQAETISPATEAIQEEFQKRWASLSMYDQEFAKATKNGTRASQELVNAVAMEATRNLVVRMTLDRLKAIATGQAEVAADATPVAEVVADAPVEEEKPKKKKASKKAAE